MPESPEPLVVLRPYPRRKACWCCGGPRLRVRCVLVGPEHPWRARYDIPGCLGCGKPTGAHYFACNPCIAAKVRPPRLFAYGRCDRCAAGLANEALFP